MAGERSVRAVPRAVVAGLALALVAQGAWHALRPPPSALAEALPPPPPIAVARVASLGEEPPAARLAMLWLQSHDNQPGLSIPFARLDYARVASWLGWILALDPRTEYPLLAASRVYGNVADPVKKRLMFEFVYDRFLEAPDRRWRWLAHAAIEAKHRLEDLPLALRYARAITDHATGPDVPAWARDMSVVVLEDMGEIEAARILLGSLLATGRIKDEREIRFLVERLEAMAPVPAASAPTGPKVVEKLTP